MKTKSLFRCLGEASRENWACRGVAPLRAGRSWILSPLIAAFHLLTVGQAPAQVFTSLGTRASLDNQTFLGNTVYASLHGSVLSGNIFYATAPGDDESGFSGSVYGVNTDGTGGTNLHSFSYVVAPGYGPRINADGAFPNRVILSGATLYGTAYIGGSAGLGTVFAVNINGTGFTNLHNFTTLSGGFYGTNSEGAFQYAGLILLGNTLYGTTGGGGSSGNGTVFGVSLNGTGFTTLYSFPATYPFEIQPFFTVFTNQDGALPLDGLALSGNTFYGRTSEGGSLGTGTVFKLAFGPQLTIARSGTKVILSWPTNVAGFDYTGYTLQSTTGSVSSAVWSTNSPAPVVIAGQNTVTNPITGTRQFYRLVQ